MLSRLDGRRLSMHSKRTKLLVCRNLVCALTHTRALSLCEKTPNLAGVHQRLAQAPRSLVQGSCRA